MAPVRARLLLLATLAALPAVLRADPAGKDPARCLGQLLTATGLGATDGLELGGDAEVVLVHSGEGATSRYWVFSTRGHDVVDKPWPKNGPIGFVVSGLDKPRRYAWFRRDGVVVSQSNQVVPVTVTADRWAPLDDAAWKMVERVVAAKLPKLLVQLKEHRDEDAKKHMRFTMANGWAETYEACKGLPGDPGKRVEAIAAAEQTQFLALAKAPLEFVHYDVVRRQDHPEWRQCRTKRDCVVVDGPCGAADVVAKSAKKDYASWARTREAQINCDQPDETHPNVACEAALCIDSAAVLNPRWSTCNTDADCQIDLSCDAPVAINKRTRLDPGYQRWHWFRTVDSWDRCAEVEEPKPGSCVAGSCVVR
jgi:hypothetical protein